MASLKKISAVLACAALALGTAACSDTRSSDSKSGSSAESTNASDQLVGISMPTKSLERWNRDGAHLQELLDKQGYKTDLQYADNKVGDQISQIENMVNKGAKILVVASIDGSALAPTLDKAHAKGVKVIAYDRLIRDTESVDFYATFDNYKVGKMQGEYLVKALGLDQGKTGINFEPFAGSPDDNNASFFFAGAWDVLNPYVEKGALVVPSGKAPKTNDQWQSIGIKEWSLKSAQDEMQTRLNTFYKDKKVQAVLSPNDSIALGITQALVAAGYQAGPEYPQLTGQDADEANVKNIIAGLQSMTVWKDTRTLGEVVAKMVDEVAQGKDVTVNDKETYDNGKKVVPAYLIDPVTITKENINEKLVDSGFYSKSDLGL
ncbi:ABC transporter substrate-binding protein [Boudabousia liubingyangii]|uniref:ABC transporter substrate-binding protein n=1 Tax=Boudabousia liubingyangii TaxID=1921764 RepID=A0A1Q5PMW9_9ACTO|nr:multiple monosaccharide ABC transporter substrate-binding protein [Boudabousia liubingyangii]OKL47454.1 ABC transporter substrate-binding protein [Boudabousia liubingyangii]OKL48876.1 ABC transporter substrate-binding protein [Boudabousia liubingyangii]